MRRNVPIWVFPITFLAFGFATGFGLARFEAPDGSWLDRVSYGGDADAARSLVSNVLTGIVSITTLTLTVTIVTLQLASSQYSPRVMKRYLRDRSIQLCVSFFLFAFALTLPVLFHIRSGEDAGSRFVPGPALSVVITVSMLSLVGLVYFVFHVTRTVRVENILEGIADDVIARVAVDPGVDERSAEDVPDDARAVSARSSGFVLEIDEQVVASHLDDGSFWFDVGIGDYVVEGAPLGWYAGPADPDELSERLCESLVLGPERDGSIEAAFGLRQIVDIGVKALSPGVNDPTTAIVSLNGATRVLVAAGARVGSDVADAGGSTSVWVPRPTWGELVFNTIDQFATYGSGDVQFVRTMVRTMKRLVMVGAEIDSAQLRRALDSLEHHLETADVFPAELDDVRDSLDRCRRHLDGSSEGPLDVFAVSTRII